MPKTGLAATIFMSSWFLTGMPFFSEENSLSTNAGTIAYPHSKE